MLFVTNGCNDNSLSNDETKPIITSVNFLDGNTIPAGDSVNVRISFTDDVALSEAFVEVHDNFESHKHQKVNTKFSGSEILSLEGLSDAQVATFVLPNNAAAGPYHMNISVLDKEGNRSDVKVLEFFISQPGQPVFKSIVKEIDVSANTDFTINFEVEDDVDLKEIFYIIEDHNNPSAEPLFDGDIDLLGADDLGFTFNQKFSVNQTFSELEFIVGVFDSDDNLSIAIIDIHVQ